jgi:hypothetical protein
MAKAAKKKKLKFIPPSQARLRRLLARGYFPSELPPPFTTMDFGRHAHEFMSAWDVNKIIKKFWTRPERYPVPRYGDARRVLSVVNPINQLCVAHLISTNWLAIRQRVTRSNMSEFDPQIVLKGPGRAVKGVDFDGVARRRAEILGSYGRYVKTDIARFYPSVYTHAIPWSLLGKEYVKANHNSPAFKASFANLLDKAVGSGQQGQTIGIPIGPDTSRIVSELIAVEVELLAKEHIGDLEDRAVRYVDDMLIGLTENETPSAVLSGISLGLYEYELELNGEKTVTHGIGCPHAPEWIHFIRRFEISSWKSRQRDDLDSYFEQALHLADANLRENVLLFAAKRAASFDVHQDNMAHFVRWLLYCARRAPSALSFVAEHLAAIKNTSFLPDPEIETYILEQIPQKAEAVHPHELAWLLFWAREIGLKLPAASLEKTKKLRSSVAALIALDLRDSGRIDGVFKVPEWNACTTAEGLKSEMWLLSYEATKKGWWLGATKSAFITNHEYFASLWDKDVEFYNRAKKAKKKVMPSVFSAAAASTSAGAFSDYPNL